MKKIIFFLFNCLVLCGCSLADDFFHEKKLVQPTTFLPTEKHQLLKEEFIEEFNKINSTEDYKRVIVDAYNYVPESYVNQYNLGAFEVYFEDGIIGYYLYSDDKIYTENAVFVDSSLNYDFVGFVSFAILDVNNDCDYEFMASIHRKKSTITDYILAIDTDTQLSASKTMYHYDLTEEEYYFFKKDNLNNISLYTSKNNNLENAKTLYSNITFNRNIVYFTENHYHLTAKNYEVDIDIDMQNINFPIYFEGLKYSFKIDTKLKWLGESFSYINGDSYLEGAVVTLKNKDDVKILPLPIIACEVITPFTILTNQIIDSEYLYEIDKKDLVISDYDMFISYRFDDEVIKLDNVLVIDILMDPCIE